MTSQCIADLHRFSGNYALEISSREVGITNHSTEGEDICGAGADFFGDIPRLASIAVSGNRAEISAGNYSFSGDFRGPSGPVKPLVGGTFFKELNPGVSPVKNSCGTKSPLFSARNKFNIDGGTTDLTVWVYAQEDAISVVAESFWIADGSEILSPCHGVLVLQGTK